MLRKLLKYDMLAVWKNGWGVLPIMALCTTAATIAMNIMLSVIMNSDMVMIVDSVMIITCAFVVAVGAFGLFGCGVVIAVLLLIRFYHNFYSDEGYLTFTLPVKRNTLLLSKTISTCFYVTVYIALVVGCISVFLTFGGFEPSEIEDFLRVIGIWYDPKTTGEVILYFGEYLTTICDIFLNVMMVQFAVALGCSGVRKAKIALSAGIYMAANSVVSLIFLPKSLSLFGVMSVSSYYSELGSILEMVIYSLISIALGLIFYFMTLDRLSRKLNID